MSLRHNLIFRTDASIQIGTGHVMRCITLADALVARGWGCAFICREHPGNLIEFIRGKGYIVHVLPVADTEIGGVCMDIPVPEKFEKNFLYSDWLGADQEQDAEACAPILAAQRPDWLIVDHYALDARWERTLAPHYRKLMVIDDLADRYHDCDMLLDQTFGRDVADYRPLVPADCHLLCGSQYALLRPEFATLRPYSLQRRAQPVLRELLITMGGVDKDNSTGLVLKALRFCQLPTDFRITVVMGATALWLDEVCKQAQCMSRPTRVLVGVSDMAQLMTDCDLAIGAAGATSWERCCLGLPTIMVPLADNQVQSCRILSEAGAGLMIPEPRDIAAQLPQIFQALVAEPVALSGMVATSATITDGRGIERVSQFIEA